MNHTKGPWTVRHLENQGSYYIDECARSEMDAGFLGSEVAVSNAHLIAAAPELLEALQNLLSDYAAITSSGRTINQDDIYKNAISAIQKAKGL